LRIGIHAGEVQIENGTVRGAAVHRAAHLCVAARADSIVASRETLEAVGGPVGGLQQFALIGTKERVAGGEIRWES